MLSGSCDKVERAVLASDVLDAAHQELGELRYDPKQKGRCLGMWEAAFSVWLERQNDLHGEGCAECAKYREVTSRLQPF